MHLPKKKKKKCTFLKKEQKKCTFLKKKKKKRCTPIMHLSQVKKVRKKLMQQSIENSEIKYTANISFIWINLKLWYTIKMKKK